MKDIISGFIKWIIINFLSKKLKSSTGEIKGTVLVSFIIHPFFHRTNSHPNEHELDGIVESFLSLGYNVVVVDYRRKKIKGNYDVIFGFGDAYDFACFENPQSTKILYSTGSPSIYQNERTTLSLKRALENHPDHRLLIDCLRYTESNYSSQLVISDSIIAIGNKYIKSLFEPYNNSVYLLPAIFNFRNISVNYSARLVERSFLWFGGKGSVHKGLDLCIDYFTKNTKVKLYIAGPLDKEIEAFQTANSFTDNIQYLGSLDINSEEFSQVIKKASFVLLPSCSEGTATSVLTCAASGSLIPVVSKECGINVNYPQFELGNIYSAEAFSDSLDKILSTSDEVLLEMMIQLETLKESNPIDSYKDTLLLTLDKILQERNDLL